MNPVDEFLAYEAGLQKEAMTPAVKSALITGGITAGTIALGTVATGAAQDVLDMARNAVSRTIDFRRMIKENPDLKKLDRTKTQAYFNTLHRFSPEMAGDPVVAASWVKRMGEFDYVDPATVQQLVSTSERMRSAKSQQRIPPFMLAQAATMAGMDRMREMRADLTPAQRAQIEAQRQMNIDTQLAKARADATAREHQAVMEHTMRTGLAQQQAEHAGKMRMWEAGLHDPKMAITPPPSPAFR